MDSGRPSGFGQLASSAIRSSKTYALLQPVPSNHRRRAALLQFLRPNLRSQTLSEPSSESAQRRNLQRMWLARTFHTSSPGSVVACLVACRVVPAARRTTLRRDCSVCDRVCPNARDGSAADVPVHACCSNARLPVAPIYALASISAAAPTSPFPAFQPVPEVLQFLNPARLPSKPVQTLGDFRELLRPRRLNFWLKNRDNIGEN